MSKATQFAAVVDDYNKTLANLLAQKKKVINTPEAFHDDETISLLSLLEQTQDDLLTPELLTLKAELREKISAFSAGVEHIYQESSDFNGHISRQITAHRTAFEKTMQSIPENRLSSILKFELNTLNENEISYLVKGFKEINCFAFVREQYLVVYYDRLMMDDIKTFLNSADYHFKKSSGSYFIKIVDIKESLIPLLPNELVYLLTMIEQHN